MYDDALDIKNKIISDTDIIEILEKMNEYLLIKNKQKDESAIERIKCDFSFEDNNRIEVSDYSQILNIFNNRFREIKGMNICCWFSTYREGRRIASDFYLSVTTDNIKSSVSINDSDDEMKEVYNFVKSKIVNAPTKYDRVIRKKSLIKAKVGFALGVIPSIVICTFLLFVPAINEAYHAVPLAYPILSVVFGYMIGVSVFSSTLDNLYEPMLPNRKTKWDTKEKTIVRYDDIEQYVSCGEVIIGKNSNNLKNRKEILSLEEKYSKFIPIELLVILIISLIIWLF